METQYLHNAILYSSQDLHRLKQIVNKENVNKPDDTGWTPLHYAIEFCTVTDKANADYFKSTGAIIDSGLEIPQLLLSVGANANAQDFKKGWAPLHYAAHHAKLEFVKLLIKKGKSNVNAKSKNGVTPLHVAVMQVDKPNCLEVVKVLLANGADINSKEVAGYTPFHTAINESSIEMVQYLAKARRLDINARQNNGATALHLAVVKGSYELVELLIKSGADVSVKDEKNCTPLFLSEHLRLHHITRLLKNYRAIQKKWWQFW